jgi:DNA-directed RNA polymerase specialized sigma24 family protein
MHRPPWTDALARFRTHLADRLIVLARPDVADTRAAALRALLRRIRTKQPDWDSQLLWRPDGFLTLPKTTPPGPDRVLDELLKSHHEDLEQLARDANRAYGLRDIGEPLMNDLGRRAAAAWADFPHRHREPSRWPWLRDLLLDLMVERADRTNPDLHNGGLHRLHQICEECLPALLRRGREVGWSDRIEEFVAQAYLAAARAWWEFDYRSAAETRNWLLSLAGYAGREDRRRLGREGLTALTEGEAATGPASASRAATPASAADDRADLRIRAEALLARLTTDPDHRVAAAVALQAKTCLELTVLGDLFETAAGLSARDLGLWARHVLGRQTNAEIARATGERKGTVATRLCRLRERIDAGLADVWAADPRAES